MGNQKQNTEKQEAQVSISEIERAYQKDLENLSAQVAVLKAQAEQLQINEIGVADFHIKSSESLDRVLLSMDKLIKSHSDFAEKRRLKRIAESHLCSVG